VDASTPNAPHQTAHVLKVLAEIGAEKTRQIFVLNKMDRLNITAEESESLAQRILGEVSGPVCPTAIAISARSGAGFDAVPAAIDKLLPLDPISRVRFQIPASDGAVINLLHERGRVLRRGYREEICEIEAEVPESVKRGLARFVVE
jgi:50S ribosomal subunit-associated GTPase HflX